MNCIQYVTITGNLSFTPALRGCLVQYDLLKPVISSDDAFDPVGCLSALNFRYLQQLGQGILMCLPGTAASDILFYSPMFSFNILFSEFNIVILISFDLVAFYHIIYCQSI